LRSALRSTGRRTALSLSAAAALGITGTYAAATANAAPSPAWSRVCGAPTGAMAACNALRVTNVHQTVHAMGVTPNATPSGYGPSDLLSAYNLPANGGAGQTVAIVDAHDDPSAEADLALYRA